MKKLFAFLLFVVFCNLGDMANISAAPSLNVNDDVLTNDEGMFLNKIAETLGVDYEFRNKKVAFYTGNVGSVRVSKATYLNHVFATYIQKFYLFDIKEQNDTRGYDAAVIFGAAKMVPSNKKMVKQIRRHQQKKKNKRVTP